MIVFLIAAVASAGIAAWLWGSAPTPAERLHAIRRAGGIPSGVASGIPGSRSPFRGDPGAVTAVHGFSGPGTTPRTGYRVGTGSSGNGVAAGTPVGGRGRETAPRHGPGTEPFGAFIRKAVIVGAAGSVGFLLAGGLVGAVAAVGAAGVVFLAPGDRRSRPDRREGKRLAADLPLAAELMVACLKAGQPLVGAVEAVASALGGPLGERLSWVGGQLRLGAHPEVAWSSLLGEEPVARLARTMIRAAETGAPVAEALARLGDDAALAVRTASLAAARRVGVQTVAPLGLCFLPAFVLLGIVPVVAGLAAHVVLP